MSKDELGFANEVMDMLDLRIKHAEVLVDLAKRQEDQIKWRIYEEDLDERVKKFLRECV